MKNKPSLKGFPKTRKQLAIPIRQSPRVVENEEKNVCVGQRLRELRISQGLTMRSLSGMSGLNINTLSLIENERTSPSVSTLQLLSKSLQVPITEFFQIDHADKKLVHQKHGSRSCLTFKHSVMEDLAAGMPRFCAEPIIVTLGPGADSGKSPIVHTGREFVYCLEGRIAYTVESKTYLLEAGDSLIFEAYLPHQWENADPTPSRVLLVLCPLDERDQPKEQHFAR
ncbi:MAG: cupin domain-containing protein [Anaerolineales bacterium]|nr:cupin domain-containing protein [Anaerolineales bacterium]